MAELQVFSNLSHDSRIFIAGHRGLVGSAITRRLRALGFSRMISRTRSELDLLDQQSVDQFFSEEKPDFVFLAAAKVGGILSNATYQAEFLYENLTISTNVIHSSFRHGVKKLMYLGSSCIYPKFSPQPIPESALLTGPLEPTNEGYAIAKIAGLKMCEKYFRQYGREFISVMPTNLYGPNDNFDPDNSHVIPGMMRRFHEAKVNNSPTVSVWGSGQQRREFMHVDDFANAAVAVMESYSQPELLNIGTGEDCTILELSEMLKNAVGYKGQILLDTSKPDGTPRKVLDVSRLRALGWRPSIELQNGLAETYQWALQNSVFESELKREPLENSLRY